MQNAWDPALAMPCTAYTGGVCTETTYDSAYVATITVADGSYNLTDSTNYPIKLQGTASTSMGCGPTCTCPAGQPSCDLSAVADCASQCYIRTKRDEIVPAKIRIKPFTAGTTPAFSVGSGSAVALVGGPSQTSRVDATFENLKFSGTSSIVGISLNFAGNAVVRNCRFSTLKYGAEINSNAVAGNEMQVIDSQFTKCAHGLSVNKAGTTVRMKTENGYGTQMWGNSRGCVHWGSGHFTLEAPLMCYLQGGSSTSYSSSAMGIYTATSAGEGGINVSTATLDSATGAITSAGTATEGLDPDTGMPYFQIMGTGSASGSQYLFQYGLFADKTAFIALRNVAISNLGTGICQNMVSGASAIKRVTLANVKITNYKTMYYKGAGSAYCVSPDLTATPQLANTNATSTASPMQFNPLSGICLTTDWKAPADLTPNYQSPVLPNPYPSDTSGILNPPGGTCSSSSVCANSGSCCPATGTQTCGTGGSTDAITGGICMCLGVNVKCGANSQCCGGYCHPTELVCTCAVAGASCTANSQCCGGVCTSNVCAGATPTATPAPTATLVP
ncbi:MAG: hypothetical protein ACR2J8_15565 [Thermomicrobiales bacterium]